MCDTGTSVVVVGAREDVDEEDTEAEGQVESGTDVVWHVLESGEIFCG